MAGVLEHVKCPDGKCRTYKEAAKIYGIAAKTLCQRVRRGLRTIEVFKKNLKPKARVGVNTAIPVPMKRLTERSEAEQLRNLLKLKSPTKLDEEMSKHGTIEYGQVRAK